MTPKTFPRAGVAAALCAASVWAAGPALAAEVDLAAAGCGPLPEADRFMTVHLVLNGDGTAQDCAITSEVRQFCQQAHSFEEGFLCLGLTRNPRPDITSAETAQSRPVDRLTVDGEVIVDMDGKTVLRRDLGTGPSGETYDVVAELGHGGRTYVLTVNVTAAPDGPVRFNEVSLDIAD